MASFVHDTTPWCGGRITDTIQCVRANNSSPMTYVGTNTWIITGKASSEHAGTEHDARALGGASPAQPIHHDTDTKALPCVVVDPAPAGEQSRAVLDMCREQNLVIRALVLTHHHFDHTEGAQELSQATGASIYARDTHTVPGTLTLPIGAFCPFEGAPAMAIVDLPGHSPDSIGILLPEEHALITGDVVFRHGPTVVYYPEGHLESYLATLDKLDELIEEKQLSCFLPGHGYPLDNPPESIAATRQHRLERLDQIRTALAAGIPANAEDLYNVVYQGTDPHLKDAAIRSIKAQLEYLGL